MLIKFTAPDPRAGMVAQMDSSRGAYFVDNGFAVAVKEGSQLEVKPLDADQAKPKPSKKGK
jgi:hypothetical protein